MTVYPHMLSLQKVSKKYQTETVLSIDQFQFEKGLYWIKGVNGAGKTTLFKVMSGILSFEGDVIFNNLSLKNNPVDFRQKVSYAPAEPIYPPYLTGFQLLRFMQRIRSANHQQLSELQSLFNTQEYSNQQIETYSSGMLKKISLIMAFLGNCPILLLDEPFITLDTASVRHLYSLISARLHTGAIVLISTHQPLEIVENFSCRTVAIQEKTLIYL
jgi:ABC-2 type transport system ATP-binding protein